MESKIDEIFDDYDSECVSREKVVNRIMQLFEKEMKKLVDERQKGEVCEWTKENDLNIGDTMSGCSKMHYPNYIANHFEFCPHCGKKIKVKEG